MKTLEKLGLDSCVIKKPEFSDLGVGLCMCTFGKTLSIMLFKQRG